MAVEINRSYILGDYQLEPDKRRLSRAGRPIHLAKKPFQVLLYLVEHRDRVVSRNELLDHFWEGKEVYDVTLTQCVVAIRNALGESSSKPRFIETRHAEGYRYIGPLQEQVTESELPSVEIEKTRAVRIVVEEEEIADILPESEQVAAIQLPASPVALIERRRSRWPVALAIISVAIAAAAIVLLLQRNRVSPTELQPSAIRSIAVLPLKNLSADPENEYFSDGLTESFITELSKIKELKVISRNSVFTFKEKDVDPREVGKRLGVEAILEGSVRKSADTVRVEVRLVSTHDGRVIWVGDFDRALKEIFAVEDEIGCSVAKNLRVVLCGEGEPQLAKHYTENVDAYQALLKARYFANKRTPEGLKKAIEYCQEAIDLDPRYAPAYTELAAGYLMGIWYIPLAPEEAVTKARAAASKALEIDDTFPEAHHVMAAILQYEWDWAGRDREWERVFELDSTYDDYGYAYTLIEYNRDEAVRWIKRAEELDPLSLLMGNNVGEILYYARRYDEAIIQLKKVLELDPNYAIAYWRLGDTYTQKGMYDEAIEAFRKAIVLSYRNPEVVARLGHAYAAAGRRGEAEKALDELLKISKRDHVSPYIIAWVFAGLGDKDKAIEMLEKAYQQHDPHIIGLGNDPPLDTLRSDARYQGLLRRVGLPG